MTLHPYTRLFAKSAAPTVDDDLSAGYEVGDIWTDTVGLKVYQCLDTTEGVAVWVDLTAGGSAWVGVATSDLNMSNYDIDNVDTANFIMAPDGTLAEGGLQWAVDDETLQIGLHGGVALQIGQETMILAKNQTGAPLTDGKVVSYDGAIGVSGRMKVKYAIADGTQNARMFLGVVTETIANGDDGFITTFGKVRGIQTNGANYGETWVDGDILWISPTVPGGFTNVEPTSPHIRLPIAVVVTAHATTGTIFVRMTNGVYMEELHDTKIAGITDKDMLTYNSSNGMWENGPVSDLTTLGHFQDINRFGFIASYDGTTGTTISFNPATYTFTLTDTGSGWGYYLDGVAYRFTGNRTIVLTGTPPAKGAYFIFFSSGNGVLQQDTVSWSLEGNKVPVALILWDNALTPKYWLSDERHTSSIDRRLHLYLHTNLGSRWNSGGITSGYSVGPVSPTDANNTFGISQATLYDEDIKNVLPQLVDPDGTTNSYVIMFKSGGSWVWEYSTMPYRLTAAGYIQYDNAGTMTQGQGSKYYNTYLLITNFIEASAGVGAFQIIHGKQEFSSLADAVAEDPYSFDFTGFPLVECAIGWQFTWQTNAAYSSKGKCRLAAAPRRLGAAITSSITSVPGVTASAVTTDVVNFGATLSASDTTVQKALDTLDNHTHGSNSFVVNAVPTGTINGTNTVFQFNPFVPGSLWLFRDGQLMKPGGEDYTETDPTTGTVTFVVAPATGSILLGSFQQSVTISGNADTLDGYHASSFVLASDRLSGLATLADGGFNITGADGVYQDTGLYLDLPSAGTYALDGSIRGVLQDSMLYANIIVKFYNSTDAVDIPNTQTLVAFEFVAGALIQTFVSMLSLVTVNGPKTIKLYAYREHQAGATWYYSQIGSNSGGWTRIRYVKVG